MEPITIAIVSGIAGVVFSSVASQVVPKCLDDILIFLQGKKIAVLGERRVGKTTLIKYLTEGVLLEDYIGTLASKETKKRRFKLNDLDIIIKKSMDVSGSGNQNTFNAWKNLFKDSDLVFYLVRADKLLENDYDTRTRVIADMNNIQSWINDPTIYKKQRIFIIGNHWEPHPNFSTLYHHNPSKFLDDFVNLESVERMMSLANNAYLVKVVIGSLASQKSADKLITQLFQEVVNDGR